jgi:hypothetical protein
MPSVAGPIPITLVAGLRDKKNEGCFGIWRATERDVRLEAAMAPTTAWLTYWHEWAHVVFWESGIQLEKDVEERIVNALALARVREMLDNGGKP